VSDDRSGDLIEDIIEGIAHGDVADSAPAFRIRRRDESAIEVDFGDTRSIYVTSITLAGRVE
jgi:hypothetical protein